MIQPEAAARLIFGQEEANYSRLTVCERKVPAKAQCYVVFETARYAVGIIKRAYRITKKWKPGLVEQTLFGVVMVHWQFVLVTTWR